MPSPLQDKSKAFALKIITVCNEIKRSKRESVLTNQLIRSGTSIGANIAEARYGISKKDFISKIYISLKECAETIYWLELLASCSYIKEAEYRSLLQDCEELRRILSATTRTAQ